MKNELQGKTALILGGADRVGRSIALELAEAGVECVITYNESEAAATETIKLLDDMGTPGIKFECDLSHSFDVDIMLARLLGYKKQVDILIHAADYFEPSNFSDLLRGVWTVPQHVGPWALLQISQTLVPQMQRNGYGHIISILDQSIYRPEKGFAAHSVAKATLAAMTRMMAVELAPHIQVNAVVPGMVIPPKEMGIETAAKLAKRNLMGRWSGGWDVAHAVRFLLESRFLTGQEIMIDGGEFIKHA